MGEATFSSTLYGTMKTLQINVSHLPQGVYIAEVMLGNQKETRKVVIAR